MDIEAIPHSIDKDQRPLVEPVGSIHKKIREVVQRATVRTDDYVKSFIFVSDDEMEVLCGEPVWVKELNLPMQEKINIRDGRWITDHGIQAYQELLLNACFLRRTQDVISDMDVR